MMSLKEQVKKFPKSSGVYLFLSKSDKVIYVGRATSLRKRVLNYFEKGLEPKVFEMVGLAKKVKYIKTNNLLEAVILEANLIKKYWPKYNIKERDNRSFIYLVIFKKDFTHPIIVRGQELKKFPPEKAEIFGPYQSITIVNNALKILRRFFPYSTCKINSGKPCFDYQIGLCPGACIGAISKEDYQKNIDNLILFLKGENKKLFKIIAKENPEKLKALKHIQDAALISKEDYYLKQNLYRIEGYDISYFQGKISYGSMVVFINSKKSPSNYRIFKIKETQPKNDLEALAEVIRRRLKHSEWRLPDLIVIDGGKPQIDYLSKLFKQLQVKIPFVGISKYQGDKSRSFLAKERDRFVFPKNTKTTVKNLIESQKNTLLKVRDEAHRFALKFSRKTINLKK